MSARRLLPLASVALLLAGCEDESPETGAGTDAGEAVWSFDDDGARVLAGVDGPLADRLPGSPAETILTPATTLFPGVARIDPQLENPFSGDAGRIAAGERHFAAFNCSGCHAPLGGGGMGPPLSDASWIYGDEPAQIYLSIMQGRPNGMPAFGSMLPEQAVWELAAYIETLDEIENPAQRLGFVGRGGVHPDAQAGRQGAGTGDGAAAE